MWTHLFHCFHALSDQSCMLTLPAFISWSTCSSRAGCHISSVRPKTGWETETSSRCCSVRQVFAIPTTLYHIKIHPAFCLLYRFVKTESQSGYMSNTVRNCNADIQYIGCTCIFAYQKTQLLALTNTSSSKVIKYRFYFVIYLSIKPSGRAPGIWHSRHTA